MALASLIVKIGADLSGLNKALNDTDKKLQRMGGKLQSIGTTMSAAVTLPLVGLAGVAVSAAADMDSLMRGLTAVSGSAEEAGRQFDRLKQVAKLPGLGLEEAVQGSINLQAAGFNADLAESSLMAFGNALATVGKGKADLDGVITALTQIASKGSISAEEINQIAERVPQIRQVMQDAFGTSNTEELQAMGIEATAFVEKITAELAKLPPVSGGAQNSFENLSDTLKQLAVAYGEILLPPVLAITEKLATFAEWLTGLDPAMQTTILAVGGFAAALGPLLLSLGTLLKLLPVLKLGFAALTGPIGLTVAAITGLATAWIIWGDDVKRIVAETVTAVTEWFGRLAAPFEVVKNGVGAVTEKFRDMWDKVVGNSYVPDMVDGIALEFARLDAVMVQPALAAVGKVNTAFASVRGPAPSGDSAGGGALGGIMGALTGGKSAGGILGNIGKTLLGGLGLAGGPAGILGSIGVSLAGPLVNDVMGKITGGIKGAIGNLFGRKKQSKAPFEAAGEVMSNLTRSANQASEALSNVPNVFKVAAVRPPVGAADPYGRPPGKPTNPPLNVTVNVSGSVISERDLGEVVGRAIDRAVNRGGTTRFAVALT